MNLPLPLPRSLPALLLVLTLAACSKSDPPPPPVAGEPPAPAADGYAPAPTVVPDPPATAAPAPAPEPATAPAPAASTSGASGAAYQVVDGYKVDAVTLTGFRTWRAAACDRCHGANQEGMVGPSLITAMKNLSQDEFKATVLNGRLEKGMPSFGGNPGVVAQIDALYIYLKGRSDGAITRAKVEPMS